MRAARAGRLTWVSVDISHNKVHAQDAEAGSQTRIDKFERRIKLSGDLDADQTARLLEIADKCPVHRTLEQGAHVTTVLES